MSSSESFFARRAARFYGHLVQKSRPERIGWLRSQIVTLEALDRDEHAAHRAICMACQDGDFCLDAISITPAQVERSKKIGFMRSLIHSEEHDEAYAQAARAHGVEYSDHIDGFCAYWQNVRHRKFEAAGWKCEHCGRDGTGTLDAHHLHYDTLGFEELCDLEALCRGCHKRADRGRAANTRYSNAKETYLRKKYGEDYELREGDDEEFGEWFERKQKEDDDSWMRGEE